MRQRRETVEHPFGTIKARMGDTARLASQHLLTIGRVRDFFALLLSSPFNGCGAEPARATKWG
jgi:hypothetical protein